MKLNSAVVLASAMLTVTPTMSARGSAQTELQTKLVKISKDFMDDWKAGKSAALADILTQDFIYASPQGAVSRQTALNVVSHCQLSSYSFERVEMRQLSADAAVLIYKLNQDLTCFGKKEPAATINSDTFVRRGGKWKIVLTTQTTLSSG
ncbi:nuclear transport factor 2 family protein [Sphingomonas sp. ASV193]|uniref:nuclear transport factor 2 family protein n=1 Tax=Sphingomonas sp. ASV193 TaxID=3144405 RepID=UPI0032E858B1